MAMFGRKRADANAAGYSVINDTKSAPKKGTDWGEVGRNVLGNIGDAIALHYGGAPVFGPMQQQALAFQQQGALLAERQRQQAELQAQRALDAQNLHQFKVNNPTPDNFDRALGRAQIDPNSEQGLSLSREYANRLSQGPDPIVQNVSLGPGRGQYTGPLSGLQGAAQGPQARGPVTRPQGMTDGDLITRARQAIQNGADPAAVKQRLLDMGVRDPATM